MDRTDYIRTTKAPIKSPGCNACHEASAVEVTLGYTVVTRFFLCRPCARELRAQLGPRRVHHSKPNV